jgi:Protein of unknown function (DUF1573)
MKIYARKKTILALAFLCISFYFPPAFATTQSPVPKQQAPEAKAHPSMQVKDPDYNFGKIMEGSEIEHEFSVRNTGKKVLNIERVRVD